MNQTYEPRASDRENLFLIGLFFNATPELEFPSPVPLDEFIEVCQKLKDDKMEVILSIFEGKRIEEKKEKEEEEKEGGGSFEKYYPKKEWNGSEFYHGFYPHYDLQTPERCLELGRKLWNLPAFKLAISQILCFTETQRTVFEWTPCFMDALLLLAFPTIVHLPFADAEEQKLFTRTISAIRPIRQDIIWRLQKQVLLSKARILEESLPIELGRDLTPFSPNYSWIHPTLSDLSSPILPQNFKIILDPASEWPIKQKDTNPIQYEFFIGDLESVKKIPKRKGQRMLRTKRTDEILEALGEPSFEIAFFNSPSSPSLLSKEFEEEVDEDEEDLSRFKKDLKEYEKRRDELSSLWEETVDCLNMHTMNVSDRMFRPFTDREFTLSTAFCTRIEEILLKNGFDASALEFGCASAPICLLRNWVHYIRCSLMEPKESLECTKFLKCVGMFSDLYCNDSQKRERLFTLERLNRMMNLD
jgi:hypothetical protein